MERPRLLRRMDHLKEEVCRAALISAPAGSGKTTLAVQWLNESVLPVGWVSLDERDNLPARFFAYLIAALTMPLPATAQAVMNDVGIEVLGLLDLPGVDMEEVITLLTNGLVEALPVQTLILVLDDLHVITNPQIHRAIDLLIEAQPPQLRLVLLSREDPALQLARRRARGQLVELRQIDLYFTLDEAVVFLNQSMGLDLSTTQVEILEARTEGWIAGLQMAALAMQSPLVFNQPANIERFLQDFSGSHRFILDYLMEEVLARQPAEVQAFLLETSLLERMCADLCAAVSSKPAVESQRLLEQLSKANLFVIPLDEERRWYRYHHLFRDLLFTRLQAETSTRKAELERRASDWFEFNGDARLAVEYALKAQAFRRAADLIELHITERWQTVDIEFHMMVNRLPFEVIAERPSLCLQNAWLCVLLGQTSRILPFVEAAEQALNKSDPLTSPAENGETSASRAAYRAAYRAFARSLRAYLNDLNNRPVELDDSMKQAYQVIPETNPGMRNSVAVVIGTICFMEGDFNAAMRCFEDALALDKRVNGTNAVPIATMRICFVLHAQGRLNEAMRRLRESESYVRERGIRRYYISGVLNLRMAEILLEWNRLDEAALQINEGVRLLEDWPIPTTRCLGMSQLARLHIARGDPAEGRSLLTQAEAIQQQADLHPTFLDSIEKAWVQLFIAEGNWGALEAWVKKYEYLLLQPLCFRFEPRLIGLARALLGLDRSEEAIILLERLAEAAQDRNGSRVTCLALLAAALRHRPEKALPVVDEVIRLAEPEGYIRTFIEAGESMRQVLALWLRQGPSKDEPPKVEPRLRAYVRSILSSFANPEMIPLISKGFALPEPLSQREQEVLLLLAQGLSNQQIADRLVISVRTVKKHVENIHGKLGVTNRTQAVIRAQEMGLLS